MPTLSPYYFSYSIDFNEEFFLQNFYNEINVDSTITKAISSITRNADIITVTMLDTLTSLEETALNALPAQHDPTPPPSGPLMREDGVAYATPKPSSYGMQMNDRDFRVSTCVLTDAFEDKKFNPATKQEEDWGEMSLNGVYKADGTAVADQADADANGVLSIFDFCAKLPADASLITYEMRDGILYVDPSIFVDPATPTYAERFGHRAYAVIAPDIPGSLGGSIAVFDGYLGGTPDLRVEALSPQAQVLDVSGPGGPAGVLLRLAIFHPAGSKLHHVMRLVMYRAPGTF